MTDYLVKSITFREDYPLDSNGGSAHNAHIGRLPDDAEACAVGAKLRPIFHWQYSGVLIPFGFGLFSIFWALGANLRDNTSLYVASGISLLFTLLWVSGYVCTSNLLTLGSTSRLQRATIKGYLATGIILLASLTFVGFIGEKLLESWVVIKPDFKTSSDLTKYMEWKMKISLNRYYLYLTRDVGFDFPDQIMPIGIGNFDDELGCITGTSIVTPQQINLTPAAVYSKGQVLRIYSVCAFGSSIFHDAHGLPQDILRESYVALILGDYFTHSYLGIKPGFKNQIIPYDSLDTDPWMIALWEIRSRMGHNFVDQALMYGFKQDKNRNDIGRILQKGVNQYASKVEDHQTVEAIIKHYPVHLGEQSMTGDVWYSGRSISNDSPDVIRLHPGF